MLPATVARFWICRAPTSAARRWLHSSAGARARGRAAAPRRAPRAQLSPGTPCGAARAGGGAHRVHDLLVAGAAAEIARQRFAHLSVARHAAALATEEVL